MKKIRNSLARGYHGIVLGSPVRRNINQTI